MWLQHKSTRDITLASCRISSLCIAPRKTSGEMDKYSRMKALDWLRNLGDFQQNGQTLLRGASVGITTSALMNADFMAAVIYLLPNDQVSSNITNDCLLTQYIATSRWQTCSNCDYIRKWNSQPMIKNIPAGNLYLSASIYFSGASFAKFHRVAASLGLASVSSSTFYSYVGAFLQPTILSLWTNQQKEML